MSRMLRPASLACSVTWRAAPLKRSALPFRCIDRFRMMRPIACLTRPRLIMNLFRALLTSLIVVTSRLRVRGKCPASRQIFSYESGLAELAAGGGVLEGGGLLGGGGLSAGDGLLVGLGDGAGLIDGEGLGAGVRA
jgi:hypothetical protein